MAAELFVDRERLLEVLLGGVEVAAGDLDVAEVGVLGRHALLAAELLVDGQCLLVALLGGVEVAAGPFDHAEVAEGYCSPRVIGREFADAGVQALGIIEVATERHHTAEAVGGAKVIRPDRQYLLE